MLIIYRCIQCKDFLGSHSGKCKLVDELVLNMLHAQHKCLVHTQVYTFCLVCHMLRGLHSLRYIDIPRIHKIPLATLVYQSDKCNELCELVQYIRLHGHNFE